MTGINKETRNDRRILQCYEYTRALFGRNNEQVSLWWTSYNHQLRGIPEELMETEEGIKKLLLYTGNAVLGGGS